MAFILLADLEVLLAVVYLVIFMLESGGEFHALDNSTVIFQVHLYITGLVDLYLKVMEVNPYIVVRIE